MRRRANGAWVAFLAALLLTLLGVAAGPAAAWHLKPDFAGDVPAEFLDDPMWSWREPGLFGRVLLAASASVATTTVGIADARLEVRSAEGLEVVAVVTDDGGRFRLRLQPGSYRLKVEKEGFLPVTTSFWPCAVPEGRAGHLEVRLQPSDAAPAASRERAREEQALFLTAGPLTGFVAMVHTRASADVPARPVAEAEVTVRSADGVLTKTVVADADGLAFLGLPPGAYQASAHADGFLPWGPAPAAAGAATPAMLEVSLLTEADRAADEAARQEEERLREAERQRLAAEAAAAEAARAAAALAATTSTPPGEATGPTAPAHEVPAQGATGTVKGPDGEALEGVELVFVGERGTVVGTAETGADGWFGVELSARGMYRLVARKTGFVQPSPRGFFVSSGEAADASFAMESTAGADRSQVDHADELFACYADQSPPSGVKGSVRFEMPGGAYLKADGGTVTLTENGREIKKVDVTPDGEFALAVPPGRYQLKYEHRGFSHDTAYVDVVGGVISESWLKAHPAR